VLSGEANAAPKTHDGPVEALRTLKLLQRSATKARTQALNQLRALLVTASDELRARLRDLFQRELLATCAAFRIGADDDSLAAVTRFALCELAQRALFLAERLEQVKLRLKRITEQVAPALTALKGVGPDVASTLLLAAGDNPERLVSERSFASLCGVSPVQASSGKTHRHRLNRGGARPTRPYGASRSSGSTAIHAPRTTSPSALPTARARPKRSAASSATSPAKSSARYPYPPGLDSRSIGSGGGPRGWVCLRWAEVRRVPGRGWICRGRGAGRWR